MFRTGWLQRLMAAVQKIRRGGLLNVEYAKTVVKNTKYIILFQ